MAQALGLRITTFINIPTYFDLGLAISNFDHFIQELMQVNHFIHDY